MTNQFITALRGYIRNNNFPLDASSIFDNMIDANDYALNDPTAYLGQIISVIDEPSRKVKAFVLTYNEEGLNGFLTKEIFLGDNEDLGEVITMIQSLSEILEHFSYVDGVLYIDSPLNVEKVTVTSMPTNDYDLVPLKFLQDTLADIDILPSLPEQTLTYPINSYGAESLIISSGVFIERIVIKLLQGFDYPIRLLFKNSITSVETTLVGHPYIIEYIESGEVSATTILEVNFTLSAPGQIILRPISPSLTGDGTMIIKVKN